MTKHKRFYGLMALLTAVMMLGAGTAYADVGFDAASYQGCYNAQAAVDDGARFSFIKLSEGAGYVNPYAGCQLTASRNAGLRLGAYHFADVAGLSPQAEADNFLNVARSHHLIGAGVIPVLDWEPYGNLKTQVAWAKAWLDTVAAAWGSKPLIYMSASTISMADWTPVASADYGLWVAGYPRGYAGDRLRNPGSVPYSVSPWAFAAAWQYSSSGSVAGVGSAVDVDWFYGDAATWALYAGASVSTVTKTATSSTSTTATTTKPVTTSTVPTGDATTIARAVIRGTYGNGTIRRRLLGSRYGEVMSVVNKLLAKTTTTAASSYCVTVSSGDTMGSIAARTGRTPASAWSVPSGNVNLIYPGNRVCYKTASTSTTTSSSRVWVVTKDQTLWLISQYTGVSISRLASLNNISNPNLIHIGQRIRY